MAGSTFGRVGMAIASYEWMSAITLVIVAWWLLPKFLRIGIVAAFLGGILLPGCQWEIR